MDVKSLFPGGSKDFHEANSGSRLQGSKSQRDQKKALGATVQGKTESVCRTVVRFIGYRCRPLDPDNFAGGCKDLLDGLQHSRLIHGDSIWEIDFQARQEKVAHRKDEKTIIEIEYP